MMGRRKTTVRAYSFHTVSFRSFLYWLARLLGDINAIQRGRLGPRIGRRIAGRLTGRMLGKLFRW
jgi:hypothetical protein